MSATAGSGPGIGGTFGAAYVGAMVAMALYGITVLQSYLYYMYYPKDRMTLKLLVAALWVLETVQVAFVCHAMYYYLITNYANPKALGVGVWTLYVSLLCNLIISTIVQLFFAVRVHILSSSMWWLTVLIMVSILAHIAFGLETVIDMLVLKDFSELPAITLNAALPFAITAIVPDVLITSSLCYFLQSVKSGFKGTNALLSTLMIYAVNRCLLTSIAVIVEMIMFKTLPNSLFFLGIDFCVGKLYANSLLATLNTRQVLRGKGYESDMASLSNPTPASRSAPTPEFGVGQHGRLNDPVELTDLRAAWPSGVSSMGSAGSIPETRSDLHHTHRSTDSNKLKNELDITIPPGVEAQALALEERVPQNYISFNP